MYTFHSKVLQTWKILNIRKKIVKMISLEMNLKTPMTAICTPDAHFTLNLTPQF